VAPGRYGTGKVPLQQIGLFGALTKAALFVSPVDTIKPNKFIIMERNRITETKFQLSGEAKEWLAFVICLVCMFLFLYTAYSKTIEHEKFLKGLARFKVFGPSAVYISWLVPFAELLISVLLIIPGTSKWGLYSFTGLMGIFTLYIISVLVWAKGHLPCHCGGAIEKLSWTQHIWFNLGFIALAILGLFLSNSNNSQKS
jgi:hypothetical protein